MPLEKKINLHTTHYAIKYVKCHEAKKRDCDFL